MRYINNYNNFSHEQKVLKFISELDLDTSVNESIKDWIKKIGDFFTNINDSIRNMLTMMEKGLKSLDLIKKFFSKVLEKIKSFKDKYPILFKTIIITLVLLVLLFVLCSAVSTGDKNPPEGVINAAIGLLHDIQHSGGISSVDDGTLMKAQAYLLELKKGNNINVGENAIKTAEGAIKVIQQNIAEFKQSKNPEDAEHLVKLAEQGAKLVSYKIQTFGNQLSDGYSSQNISLGYK
jgi:hypothetical protein